MTTTVIQRTPTQVNHPWRAVVRTIFQLVIALAVAAPTIYFAVTQASPEMATGAAATVLTVAGAIVRVMNTPTVNRLIDQFIPWLSANAPVVLEDSLDEGVTDPAIAVEADSDDYIASADDYAGDIDHEELDQMLARAQTADANGATPL